MWIESTDGSGAVDVTDDGAAGVEGEDIVEGMGMSFDKRLASNVSVNILSPMTNIRRSLCSVSFVETGSTGVVGIEVALVAFGVEGSCCLALILPPSSSSFPASASLVSE